MMNATLKENSGKRNDENEQFSNGEEMINDNFVNKKYLVLSENDENSEVDGNSVEFQKYTLRKYNFCRFSLQIVYIHQ